MAKSTGKASWFKLFVHQRAMMEAVPDEAVGKAIKAAMVYFDTGEETALDPVAQIVFASLKPYIDESINDFAEISKKRRESVMKRWGKAEGDETSDNIQSNTNDTNVYTSIQSDTTDTEAEAEAEAVITVSKDTVRRTDVQRIIDSWNALGVGQLKDIKAGTQRYTMLKRRIKEYGVDAIIEGIGQVKKSPFLMGGGKNGWVITFDWFIRPNNFPKVYEGNYSTGGKESASHGITVGLAAEGDQDGRYGSYF